MLLTTAESSHYSVAEVAARFQVDPRIGLKWPEANSRSKIIGYNEMPAVEEDPTWKKYIEQFKNPLILLLLGKSLNKYTHHLKKNIIDIFYPPAAAARSRFAYICKAPFISLQARGKNVIKEAECSGKI